MSVILAKSTTCCGTIAPNTYTCYPAVAVQRIIPSGSTQIVDSLPVSGFRGAQWLIVVSANSEARVRSYQVYATHRNGSSPAFSSRGFLGDSINHTTTVTTSAGFLNLIITNIDSVDIIVYATRLAIPLDYSQTTVLDVIEVAASRSVVRIGTSTAFDFVVPNQIVACTWIITATNAAGQQSGSQVFAQLIDGVSATHYSIVGDRNISYDIVITEVSGLGVELSVINTSSFDLRINVTRIPVQVENTLPYCGPARGTDLMIPPQVTIGSGLTAILDVISTSAHTGAKWLLGAMNTTSSATMLCEVNVTATTPTTSSLTQWGIIGDYIDLNLTTAIVAGNIRLSATNPLPNPVSINLLRVPTVA